MPSPHINFGTGSATSSKILLRRLDPEATATKKYEKDGQPQPGESQAGILGRRLLLDGLRKDHRAGQRQYGRPLGTGSILS